MAFDAAFAVAPRSAVDGTGRCHSRSPQRGLNAKGRYWPRMVPRHHADGTYRCQRGPTRRRGENVAEEHAAHTMRNSVAADAPRWDHPVSAWHRDRPRRLAHPTRRHPRCRRGKGGLPGGRVARRARGQRRAPGGRRRTETSPRPGAEGGSRTHRDARGLRHQPVRRVHHPRRRPGREELHDARRPGRRREHHDDRRGHRRGRCVAVRSRTRSGRSTASSAGSARRG